MQPGVSIRLNVLINEHGRVFDGKREEMMKLGTAIDLGRALVCSYNDYPRPKDKS